MKTPPIQQNSPSMAVADRSLPIQGRLSLLNRLLTPLLNLHGISRKLILLGIDSSLFLAAIYIALSLRFEQLVVGQRGMTYGAAIALTILLRCLVFPCVGLYRPVLRYSSVETIEIALKGIFFSEALAFITSSVLGLEDLPRSVRVVSALLTFIFIVASRLGFSRFLRAVDHQRMLETNQRHPIAKTTDIQKLHRPRVIIYGAGAAGFSLSRLLMYEKTHTIVAFIDDSPHLHGRKLNNVAIYPPTHLAGLLRKYRVQTVLLAIPSAKVEEKRRILQFLRTLPITIKTVPTVQEILSGKFSIAQVRNIDISDLLGREEVLPEPTLLETDIKGKVVLVTGAGGSIGSELCRQVIQQKPRHLILYELNEFALYSIDVELTEAHPDIRCTPCLGSVTDAQRLTEIFKQHGVETVYHAAAYKHVPLVESNPAQGVINNAYGTMVTAQVAVACQVSTFVLISTDKAVRPTNIMGTTKRVAELILQALAAQPNLSTRFVMVRFGNVLDSSGSVVPRFRKQIAESKPITLTHRDVTRYFMSIPEAARLVIQAGAMGKGGEVFLLDMGDPIRIYDLAVQMVELSGFQVGTDIEIQVTGLRPGEKLYEELLIGDDGVRKTRHPKIYAANEAMMPWQTLEPLLEILFEAAHQNRRSALIKALKELVPEYQAQPSTRSQPSLTQIAS